MKIYRQFPIINPDFDHEDDLAILHQESQHDWDNEEQNHIFHSLSRWGDCKDRQRNKEEHNKKD